MGIENRQHPRYKEIGRIIANELCALPGVLDDISLQGCQIHYSVPVIVDLETEYEVQISPLHNEMSAPLNLRCQPQWVKEHEGNTTIGLKILYSPDAARLSDFIEKLKQINSDDIFSSIK